jgi:hypothetical protein
MRRISMTVSSASDQPLYFGRCSACLEESTYYRILRVASVEPEFPDGAAAEGAFNDHVHGYLPLCPSCVRVCPTCERPVVSEEVDDLVERLERRDAGSVGSGDVSLSWFVYPCRTSSHERPGRRDEPMQPEPVPDPTRPPRHQNIPHWCWVAHEWRGLRVGDWIRVPGHPQPGEITEIWSHRLGGGVAATVEFADGTWVIRRAFELVEAKRQAGDGRR